MGAKHPNPRLVKIHRSYTVDEVASLLGVHGNTVREWLRRGLPTNDEKRPLLILGRTLAAFLKSRRAKSKQPCKAGELYCLRCRAPKVPAVGMVEYRVITPLLGNLMAICPDCHTIMNRRTTLAKWNAIRCQLEGTLPKAQRHIVERDNPSLNCDSNDGVQDHGNA